GTVADGSQDLMQVLDGDALGGEHANEGLELKCRGRLARLSDPGRERPTTFGSDRVDGARPFAGVPLRCPSETVRDQLLRFLIEIALGPWPEPVQAAFHLLGQLVGGPRSQRQERQHGVRGGRQPGKIFAHALTRYSSEEY